LSEQLTVSEAARRLGLTTEAVRQRIRRGSLQAEKVNGRLYVVVTPSDSDQTKTHTQQGSDATTNDTSETSNTALIEQLKRENDRLWDELHKRDEEIHRRDVLLKDALDWRSALAANAQSTPLSEAQAQTLRESEHDRTAVQTPPKRRWLSRLLGQ
jgi:excisionase family DNA binding protein